MSIEREPTGGPVAAARTRILIVDDDDRLRNLLSSFLTMHGYEIVAAESAESAWRELDASSFDLLVLDVMMPGEDGISLTRRLRETSKVPILILSAMDEVRHRIHGLEEGADDYLTKPFEPQELLLRIQAILRRGDVAPLAVEEGSFRIGDLVFSPGRREIRRPSGTVSLTEAESLLLEVLAREPGQVLTREELALRVGGLRERSVDVQVTRIRRKLESDPKRPHFLQTIRGEGYVLWLD